MSQSFSLPYVRDERFVGRTVELEQIHAALQRSDVVVLRTSGEGMGTTALAIEYAHRYRKLYDEVVGKVHDDESPWARRRMDFSAVHSMQRQPASRSVRLHVVVGRTRIAQGMGKSEDKQIITAADYDLSIQYPTVDVGPLNQHDALAMLGPIADRDPKGARALVELTCGVPLALRLVIALLSESKERRIRDMVSSLSTDADTTISSAIDRAFRLVWEALEDENARRILQLVSLFPKRTGIAMAQVVNLLNPLRDDSGFVASNISLLLRKKLLQECGDGKVSMHPRIAKLVAATVDNVEEFLRGCESNLDERLRDLDWLEDEVDSRGANAVYDDVRALQHILHENTIYSTHRRGSGTIMELLECLAERGKHVSRNRTLFLQQLAAGNVRISHGGDEFNELVALAKRKLEQQGAPHFEWKFGSKAGDPEERRVSWSRAAFCGDDCHAITVANDGRVAIWDVARAEVVEERSLGTRFHHAPAIAPVGLVVAGATNHGVELCDLMDGASLGVVNKQAEVAIAPNGRYLACMNRGDRGSIELVRYDFAQVTPPPLTVIGRDAASHWMYEFDSSRREDAPRMAISNDGRRVLVALSGDALFVWEPLQK
ncbi:MAG: hypothetical protein IPM54_19520 [Polyangiaceae bacterium]|nr:hypothetical protein [Polyangiaceae bacterium]